MKTQRIYFDHNATAPPDPAVLDAMLPYLGQNFGNASSIHSFGQRARGAVERARASVAALIGARPGEIVFTSGGTESDNTAIFGVVEAVIAGLRVPHTRVSHTPYVRVGSSGRPLFRPDSVTGQDVAWVAQPLLAVSSSVEQNAGAARQGAPHIITTAIEHHAVLHACEALQQRGVSVTVVPVGASGVVDPEDICRALRPETVLISVMHANNELGTLQPITEIARIAAEERGRRARAESADRKNDAASAANKSVAAHAAEIPAAGATGKSLPLLFHTDAVQSAGKVPLDVRALGVDLLSLSAHKFGGPQGIGALYIRTGLHLEPLLHGGPNERGRRAGTENVAGIVGMGQAAELARARLAENALHVGTLRDRLERGLLELVPGSRVNGAASAAAPEGRGFSPAEKVTASGVSTPEAEAPAVSGPAKSAARVPNTSNILFPGVDSESLVIALDLQGLACSAGAACSSGTVNPSHVLTAIGLTAGEARASVRFSLGPSNTEEDVARALELIPDAIALQRDRSTSAVILSEAKNLSVGQGAP